MDLKHNFYSIDSVTAHFSGTIMILILVGKLIIVEQLWCEIGNLICTRHLFRKTSVANLK